MLFLMSASIKLSLTCFINFVQVKFNIYIYFFVHAEAAETVETVIIDGDPGSGPTRPSYESLETTGMV